MTTAEDIIQLERHFWTALRDGHLDIAAELLDEDALSVAGHGIVRFTPAAYRAMAELGDARLTAFTFSDETVVFPRPDVAVIAYSARQSFTMDGHEHHMQVHDTTTWVRKDGRWRAVAHTETRADSARMP
ncbi:MAG: nuclear transport factor 2 family protein [Pseudoxanthomonas suwonensis]|nr:nuclear transport factor 2 family protein [Pseudoxanthomonas suwonensis]